MRWHEELVCAGLRLAGCSNVCDLTKLQVFRSKLPQNYDPIGGRRQPVARHKTNRTIVKSAN